MKYHAVLASAGLAVASNPLNDLPLPPMGFNNWARYTTHINETIFIDAADSMVKNGLLAAGYNRLNLDDAWSTHERADNGSMVWDSVKFSKGMPWLTDYMRSRGFIPGIYSDSGTLSCGGYPGTLDYEERDLQDFSDWGFEYLKLDGCNVPGGSENDYYNLYKKWHDLLEKFPKTMIFSDSAPAYFCGAKNLTDWYTIMGWSSEFGQLARHSDDVINYDSEGNAWDSVMANYGQHVRLARYQKKGFFNDPDFLITDNRNLTLDEKKSQMALWSSFSCPLIISAHIPALTTEEIELLTNKDLIAVNQDTLIEQATLASQDATWDVLTKSLANGDRLLTILNKGASTASTTISWAKLGIRTARVDPDTELDLKDLWSGKSSKVKISAMGIPATDIASHGTAVFRISGGMAGSDHPIVTPTGTIFNTFSLKCLTDKKSGTVTWTKCDGSDAQTWVLRDDDHINSLLRPNECMVDAKGKLMTRHSGCHSDAWTYTQGGNLINGNSENCLTENIDGSATVGDCGYLTNEQVVSLPVGGKVQHY